REDGLALDVAEAAGARRLAGAVAQPAGRRAHGAHGAPLGAEAVGLACRAGDAVVVRALLVARPGAEDSAGGIVGSERDALAGGEPLHRAMDDVIGAADRREAAEGGDGGGDAAHGGPSSALSACSGGD